MRSAERLAVYWVPAREHPLWLAGCEWFGRDPEVSGEGMAARESTDEPRRYGFHATLKAPLHLRDGMQRVAFEDAVRAIAASVEPFAMPRLEVAMLGRFVALRPVSPLPAAHPLRSLADRCVVELDAFRAPFEDAWWAAHIGGLDATEQDVVRRLGYLHVLDRWRFHMTLSDSFAHGPADAAREAECVRNARRHFESALLEPLTGSDIAIFVEPALGLPFSMTHRFRLEG